MWFFICPTLFLSFYHHHQPGCYAFSSKSIVVQRKCGGSSHTNRNTVVHYFKTASSPLQSSSSVVDQEIDNTIQKEDPETYPTSLNDVKSLTEMAIYNYGTEQSLEALHRLSKLCSRRTPYKFTENNEQSTDEHTRSRRRISFVPNLLSESTVQSMVSNVQYMETQRWLSDNLDSVDGLPSLHLNLVSNGQPLFPSQDNEIDEELQQSQSDDDFEVGIRQLYQLIRPYVYEVLLPKVRNEIS